MRLSREQSRAASGLDGPVRIIAGAGTGKTAVIAERYRALVAAGMPPGSILVMTFTERAAAEMRSRIEPGLGSYTGDLWIGTFHSIAQRLLREDGWRIGVPPSFRILAGADRWIQARELLWEIGDPALVQAERPDDLVNPLLRLQERLKQELIPLARLEDWARTADDRELGEQLLAAARLFRACQRRSTAERLLDFDDLILLLVRLLEQKPEVRAGYVKRFTAVLVDEYQDSNLAQERMVELLAGGAVTVVGDDDQSIYRFRGASLASLERFARVYGQATVTHHLGRNRRSGSHVVAAAAALIERNPARLAKVLSAARRGGRRVDLVHADTGLEESLQVASRLEAFAADGIAMQRIALLVRTNALARSITGVLRSRGIPFQLWGARGFYNRPEVLDLVAYLRVLTDPGDVLALMRLVSRPAAGLDPLEAQRRLAGARVPGVPALAALEEWGEARSWVGSVRRLIGLSNRLGIDELFFELMASTRYLELDQAGDDLEQRQVAANVAKFGDLIDAYRDRHRDQSLAAFMAYLELVLLSEAEEEVAQVDEVEDAVQVMTIHQAKGLEFEAVFVPALVEGRLPQPHRADRFRVPAQLAGEAPAKEDQVAEERRLLYVAMTRARDFLQLSWADQYEGSRAWRPSRFLAELEAAGDQHFRRLEVPRGALAPTTASEPDAGDRPSATPILAPAPAGAGHFAPPEPIRLSYSGIDAYRDCPRRFKYRYVFRLPTPQTVEAAYGSIVHGELMQLGRARMQGEEVDGDRVREVHERAWAEVEFPDPHRLPALRSLALRQLEAYCAAGGFSPQPLAVEEPFTAELDGWTLRGIIDRVDPPPTLEGGGWDPEKDATAASAPARLIDYKTGDPMPASKLRRDLQLALYALGARQALGLDEVELEIVYLRDASRITLPAAPALLAEARMIGRSVAEGVARGDFEPRPERRRCALCAYRLACPAAL